MQCQFKTKEPTEDHFDIVFSDKAITAMICFGFDDLFGFLWEDKAAVAIVTIT